MIREARRTQNSKQDKIQVVKSQPSVNSLREGQEVIYISKSNRLERYRKEKGRLWVSYMDTDNNYTINKDLNVGGKGNFKGDVKFSGTTGSYSLWSASDNRYTLASPDGSPTLRLLTNDTSINTNNSLGKIEFAGLDDEEDVGCMIEGQARGTWNGGSDIPSGLIFWVADDASTTLKENVRFDFAGNRFNFTKANDIDFVVSSDTVTNAIKVTASTNVLSSDCVKIVLTELPTSDPSVAGQLWNDSGTLKVSAG